MTLLSERNGPSYVPNCFILYQGGKKLSMFSRWKKPSCIDSNSICHPTSILIANIIISERKPLLYNALTNKLKILSSNMNFCQGTPNWSHANATMNWFIIIRWVKQSNFPGKEKWRDPWVSWGMKHQKGYWYWATTKVEDILTWLNKSFQFISTIHFKKVAVKNLQGGQNLCLLYL